MNHSRYRFLLILVSSVIAITLAIQLYWVFKNYEESKRQLERDIKTSFDLTVADYYTSKDKENSINFLETGIQGMDDIKLDSLIGIVVDKTKTLEKKSTEKPTDLKLFFKKDSTKTARFPELRKKKPFDITSIEISSDSNLNTDIRKNTLNDFFTNKDTVTTNGFGQINNSRFPADTAARKFSKINSISFSFSSNVIDLEKMDSILAQSLTSNDIKIDYGLKYNDGEDTFKEGSLSGDQIIESKSPELYNNTSLDLIYSGGESTLLKRNITSFLLSFLLIAGVIFCLFYMLNVINKQKNLSLIKNDLISNITHEFKTPIATASAALEGVQNFTTTGDVEKSDRYLNVGREQLTKLNLMVEKLLETATIDSEKLALQKNQFDIGTTIADSITRYKELTDKQIDFYHENESLVLFGDEFHLENAINNLLDNAIKYGGDAITLKASQLKDAISITVSDSGKSLSSKDAKYIFEKFYRVPQGDRHNVKGYGIGLFYTRAIVEKHGGTITLSLNPTTFKINLPNE